MREEKSSSPFTDRGFDVSIHVTNQENLPIRDRWRSSCYLTELGCKCLFSLFSLITSESLKDNYASDIQDLLFKRFNLDHLDDKGSLGHSIDRYI